MTSPIARAAKPKRIEALVASIRAQHPKDAETLEVLARELFARTGEEYLDELSLESAGGLVASAARFLARSDGPVHCRVYNPTLANDGWDSAHTVIESHLTDRPFIVDTARIFLADMDLQTRHVLHPIFGVERGPGGELLRLGPPHDPRTRESLVHCAVEKVTDEELPRLEGELRDRLEELRVATDDYKKMLERLASVREEIAARTEKLAGRKDEIDEIVEFLDWFAHGGFVFLGARSVALAREGSRAWLEVDRGSGLGILRREDRSTYATRRWVDEMPPTVADRVTGGPILTIARTTAESRIHRKALMDYVGVKRFDADGQVAGEHRFLGLFTSKAYAEEPADVPILRKKLEQILAAERVLPDSHDWKEIVEVFNSIPKTELLTLSVDELRADIRAILSAQGTGDVRVTFRPDALGRGLSVMVILPRDRYSEDVRSDVGVLLAERLAGRLIDDELALGEEESQARLHYYVATSVTLPDALAAELEREIAERVRTWDDRLYDRILAAHPGLAGRELAERYIALFDEEYRATTDVASALDDVAHLEELARTGAMRVALVNRAGGDAERFTTIKVYLRGDPLVLSDFLPVLENFGLRVFAEDLMDLGAGADRVYLDRFQVQTGAGERLDVDALRARLPPAILEIQAGRLESDALNRLVVSAGLTGREVDVLRTYRNLAFQADAAPSRKALTDVLIAHPDAARVLFDFFAARSDPATAHRDAAVEGARKRFMQTLDEVETAGEDRMLRAFLALVEATVRTNFYRPPSAEHPYVSIKLRSQAIELLPKPRPLFEVYVHSARMEGCHLRSAKVARGGIRWSDRHDDFRTEVLGLVKTQTVKNAVIVPAGSKGGFIVKRPKKGEDGVTEVRECYSTLMRGLLDLTDNIVKGEVVPPAGVVRWDEDDPYLVVAADKGTATFSDLANSIAESYGFWLGDAFASGGSQGYDHKKEGITARGAWECVKHHFLATGKDIQQEPFTVSGIGDMGGDVFGNGMLLSRAIRLRAAFNHAHVFLDPNPDPEVSFRERERLFKLPRSQWTDYDTKLLSPGGTITPRSAKAVTLSPEARAMLGVSVERLDGEGLVRAILAMETELFYNGGIGTYVRASAETNAEAGDASNDEVRIAATELRAKVVGEGGNLGFTQRARIEAAMRGVRLNTDAIDNSGGVDLSDHEVNLKILFRPLIESGALSMTQRNRILDQVKGDAIRHVLEHNRRQAWALSLDQRRSRTRLVELRDHMTELETDGHLDRVLEGLPDREALRARRSQFLGLTRPELAVLLAYAKISLQRELLASTRLDDPYLDRFLLEYFPPAIGERWAEAAANHRLRREIVSSELVNQTIDRMGSSFVHRMARDTGCDAPAAVAAYVAVIGLTDADEIWEALTHARLAAEDAEEALLRWESAVESACKFLVESRGALGPLAERVERWKRPLAEAADTWEAALPPSVATETAAEVARLEQAGLVPGVARALVSLGWLRNLLEIVAIAEQGGKGLAEAGTAYAAVAALVDFHGVERWLGAVAADDRWEKRAAEAIREDVSHVRRTLALAVLGEPGADLAARIASFASRREAELAKVKALSEDLRSGRKFSLAGMVVLARELGRLAARSGAN